MNGRVESPLRAGVLRPGPSYPGHSRAPLLPGPLCPARAPVPLSPGLMNRPDSPPEWGRDPLSSNQLITQSKECQGDTNQPGKAHPMTHTTAPATTAAPARARAVLAGRAAKAAAATAIAAAAIAALSGAALAAPAAPHAGHAAAA